MKSYKLTIPKPCHEDWNTMTPNEKGKFCSSCAKTVVDFTQKSSKEIQEYLLANKGQRVCGHFYRKQLDSIVIQLPETTFYQPLTFQKLFILSLLFVMGTTLFSCKTDTGKTQKIEKVEIINSIPKIEITIDSLKVDKDTIIQKKKRKVPPPPLTKGIFVVDDTKMKPLFQKDSVPEVVIMGDIVEGEIEIEPNEPYAFIQVDIKPKFKNSKVSFGEDINRLIEKKLDNDLLNKLEVYKKKEIAYAQFIVDTMGNISNIKTRAPRQKVEDWIINFVEDLPQIIPAKIDGKNVNVRYTLPITFEVD
ncbi:hypothetical protein Q4517_00405 [Tenacibaculum sp. 1_MG-2023]|uniref:hypothetical protein n=1 Tax=Tenacibaculum sp. 1_MG-2023 TaxID=3062653 RepID=UPI0026E17793|nr:hypothetical protein [Tenacibaculum sp. 1_MG-2023]MDO6674008.1 hypothetical protein [Tenacibaculum sp. 1_MG-2023]